MSPNAATAAAEAAAAQYDETGIPAFCELEVAYKMLALSTPRERPELQRNVAMILLEVFDYLP